MKSVRYQTKNTSGEIVPEISIYVNEYQKKPCVIFLNRETGVSILSPEDGKKRIDSVVISGTLQHFPIENDTFLVYDLIDVYNNLKHDTRTLLTKYLPIS